MVMVSDKTILWSELENGVTIIGLTRGRDTKLHHTENWIKGR